MRLMTRLAMILSAATIGLAPARAEQQEAPAGAPEPERVIIFFAWGKPEIDSDAAASLDKAAAAIRSDSSVRLRLVGHADRSGPAAQNLRSGRSRADAVKAYLAAHGVSGEAMTVRSLGESAPLVPTADGVREPQNRCVEILVERG